MANANEITLYREQAYRRKFYVTGAGGLADLTGTTLAFRLRTYPADALLLEFLSTDPRFVISNQATNPGEFEIVLAETDTDVAPGIYTYSIWDETADVPVVPPTAFRVKPGGR